MRNLEGPLYSLSVADLRPLSKFLESFSFYYRERETNWSRVDLSKFICEFVFLHCMWICVQLWYGESSLHSSSEDIMICVCAFTWTSFHRSSFLLCFSVWFPAKLAPYFIKMTFSLWFWHLVMFCFWLIRLAYVSFGILIHMNECLDLISNHPYEGYLSSILIFLDLSLIRDWSLWVTERLKILRRTRKSRVRMYVKPFYTFG